MRLPWVIISRDEYDRLNLQEHNLLDVKKLHAEKLEKYISLFMEFQEFRRHVAKHNPRLLQKRDAQGRFIKEKW